MPNILLDTSADIAILSLFTEEKETETLCISHKNGLSSLLLPSLQDLLNKNHLTCQDLTGLFIGTGPGSYTGTRVGVATMTMLSLALKLPLYPFCSLLLFLPDAIEGAFSLGFQGKYIDYLIEGSIDKGALIETKEKKTSLSSAKEYDQLGKEPRLSPLLPYLIKLKQSPPPPVKITYLDDF